MYILEALVVGVALKRTSTRRRICFVNGVSLPMKLLLNTVWETRVFTHLDVSSMKKTGASQRLSSVYSKIQAWSWLADEAEVAVMLDTDLYIKHSLDQAFYKLTHCKVAGAFRGKGDFRLDGPRPASSIKTKAKKDRGQGGGGINGGVVVFAPSEEEAQEMLLALKSYRPPDNSGGEQDFISQHFGLQQQIGQLDIALNYQVHQLSQTAIHDDDEGRWVSLAKRPDEINCFHFSAMPKPGNLLLGDISEESCGWLWKDFEQYAEWYNDKNEALGARCKCMADEIYDFYARKSTWKTVDAERHALFKGLAVQATSGYCNDWFDDIWPNLLELVHSQLMLRAPLLESRQGIEEDICRYCGDPWKIIGCPQHVLFGCPNIKHVAHTSWQQFGPGTATNINVPASTWVDTVRQIGANPFQVKTGNTLKIKLAYMGCLIEAYGYTDLLTPLQSTRHDQPWEGKKGKDIMNKYKESCRTHHNGDMAVAMDRYTSRGRAYTARETN